MMNVMRSIMNVSFMPKALMSGRHSGRQLIESASTDWNGMQELIIQNFVPKKNTAMAHVAEPPFEELLWTIAAARLLFGPKMNIQAPPNLTSGGVSRPASAQEYPLISRLSLVNTCICLTSLQQSPFLLALGWCLKILTKTVMSGCGTAVMSE